MNTITILGRIGREPEMRTTAGGTQILNFPVADSKKVQDNEKTTWFDCAIFGQRAVSAQQYIQKGDQICITGEMELQTWDKDDGTKGFKCAVAVSNFGFVYGNNRAESPAPQPQQRNNQPQQAGGFNQQSQQGVQQPHGKGFNQPTPPPAQGYDDFDDSIPF